MRPSVEEIVKAYLQEYGLEARPEDNEPDDDEEEQEEGSAGEDYKIPTPQDPCISCCQESCHSG